MPQSLKTMLAYSVSAAIFLLSPPAKAQNNSIQDLDWLIGDWNFVDHATNGNYLETGTRSCQYALNNRYILCESSGLSNSGKARSYLWYFNYNSMDERFEMTSIFEDYPRKNLYVLDISPDGSTIEITNKTWAKNGLKNQNEATISYDGANQYIWQIRSGEPDPVTGTRAVSFIDTVTRSSTKGRE